MSARRRVIEPLQQVGRVDAEEAAEPSDGCFPQCGQLAEECDKGEKGQQKHGQKNVSQHAHLGVVGVGLIRDMCMYVWSRAGQE